MFLRITNGFERMADNALLTRALSIITAVTGNEYFPAPTPSMATMQTAADAFADALATAQTGSNYDKALKNQKRTELINLLHSLAYYVLFAANGDVLAAQSSNFTIARERSTLPDISAPANQKLQDGLNAGELVFSFEKVTGAKGYIYQYTSEDPANNTTWKTLAGTVRKVRFTDLDKGKRYWCRAVAIGTKSQGVYSEPVSRIVQ